MKLATITDIIHWMIGKETKTIRVNRDHNIKKWGLMSCALNSGILDFEMHFDDIVLKDVTLRTMEHGQGRSYGCGPRYIGYAEGKPVVDGQPIPTINEAKKLWYKGFFYLDGLYFEQVTFLKYLWLKSDGSAYGIA